MNERIKELLEQAPYTTLSTEGRLFTQQDLAKFTELLVRYCSDYCQGHILPKGIAESEGYTYNDGVIDCALGLLQHFGVE